MSSMQWYTKRVQEQLVREISKTISFRLNDPRIPKVVTITELKLAPDTRNATVFVSFMGEETERKDALIALTHAAPFIQKCVAETVQIKHFPKLFFKLDSAFEHSEKINAILEQIKDDLV